MQRLRTIGQGGFGIVSLYQDIDGTFYAVKQMTFQWRGEYYERFKREIGILNELTHKNIVRIINYDIQEQNPWYVMPYFNEGSLRDNLVDLNNKNQRHSPSASSGIVYYIAEALKYAHSKGIIHRDLKPENILFNNREPMLADWGIGKFVNRESPVLTLAGLGTRNYCAPEQWNNGISDQRSDIYSLGIIYRELLTGNITGQIKDRKLNKIVSKMTTISPDDRYQSMENVMSDIDELNIISIDNPLKSFTEGVMIFGATIGIFYALEKIFSEKNR